MFRVGDPPYLECSTRGDTRFSPFFAWVLGDSIENHYQGAKVLRDGSTGHTWREAKNRPAVNHEEVARLYKELWRFYLLENPHLIPVIVNASGLSDMFGSPDGTCQARTLWELRAEYIERGKL